jgi:hypothetical protein
MRQKVRNSFMVKTSNTRRGIGGRGGRGSEQEQEQEEDISRAWRSGNLERIYKFQSNRLQLIMN